MRSIFLRIFLGFCLTALLVLSLFLLVAATARQTPPLRRLNEVSSTVTNLYAAGAAEAYERDRSSGLADYLRHQAQATHLTAFLFDSRGQSLGPSEGPFPPGAVLLAQQTAQTGRAATRLSHTLLEKSQSVVGPSGARYVLVVTTELGGSETVSGVLIRFLALLLATGLVCWRLAVSLASPILILRRATQRYAGGDLSARVGGSLGRRRDELGELGRDFDVMAARLESLAQAQRHLLGDISHELRSPLTRLVLALALARRQSGDSEALDRIEREAGRLDTLIDQLLTLASLEAAFDPGRAQRIHIHQLVQGVVDDADFEARSQDRRVSYSGQGVEDRTVLGIADLLRSAVENVVRNALRYTPPGSTVEIVLCYFPETIGITIRDHGPGVPAEALEEIFRPFRRIGEARDRGSGGVGLGLSITERSMALHGGTVTAVNHPDGGLCVEMILPTGTLA